MPCVAIPVLSPLNISGRFEGGGLQDLQTPLLFEQFNRNCHFGVCKLPFLDKKDKVGSYHPL